jgi:hypothetical protein
MKDNDYQFIPNGIHIEYIPQLDLDRVSKATECEFCTSYEDTIQCPTCYDVLWATTDNAYKSREDDRKKEGEERPFDTGDDRCIPPISWLVDRPTETEKLGFNFELLDDSTQTKREIICRNCYIASPKHNPICQSCDRSLEYVSASLNKEIERFFN